MKVIANETLTLRAFTRTISSSETELTIYKNDLYKVEWHDGITKEDTKNSLNKWIEEHPLDIGSNVFPTQKSFIYIVWIHDDHDKFASRTMYEYKLELTREQFEKLFSPFENHSKLYFHRIDLSTEISNEDRCNKINKFVQDTNIKIDKIFEPDSNTIDIWYTKYIGTW